MPNAQSVGTPHPDATGLNKASGIDVILTLQYTRTGLSGPTYMVSYVLIPERIHINLQRRHLVHFLCVWCTLGLRSRHLPDMGVTVHAITAQHGNNRSCDAEKQSL